VAGAVTRAEFRGNQWVVNGQKVWTTSAHKAHWGLFCWRAPIGTSQSTEAYRISSSI
jgi:alkylation response protein AidB-like acyl-CoA dehydrogenase